MLSKNNSINAGSAVAEVLVLNFGSDVDSFFIRFNVSFVELQQL